MSDQIQPNVIGDLAYEQALDEEAGRLIGAGRPSGTAQRYPTLRQGTVTGLGPLRVDGHHASLVVPGMPLAVGDVVWLLVDTGRRLLFGKAGVTA
jgi:hypothetical protein